MSARSYAFRDVPAADPLRAQIIDLPLDKILGFQRACLQHLSKESIGEIYGIAPHFVDITRQLFQRDLPRGKTLADLALRAPWATEGLDSKAGATKAHRAMVARVKSSSSPLLPHLHAIRSWVHRDAIPETMAVGVMHVGLKAVPAGSWRIELSGLPKGQKPEDAKKRILGDCPNGSKPATFAKELIARDSTFVRLTANTDAWPDRGFDVAGIAVVVAFQWRAFCYVVAANHGRGGHPVPRHE